MNDLFLSFKEDSGNYYSNYLYNMLNNEKESTDRTIEEMKRKLAEVEH